MKIQFLLAALFIPMFAANADCDRVKLKAAWDQFNQSSQVNASNAELGWDGIYSVAQVVYYKAKSNENLRGIIATSADVTNAAQVVEQQKTNLATVKSAIEDSNAKRATFELLLKDCL